MIDWGPARVDLSSSTHAPGATGSIDRWLENNYCSLTSFVFFFFLFKTGLNYNLTADVAKKEKSQQPRVYFVTSGETVGQITEKLQLSYMQEKCEHYLAYVKVGSFLSLRWPHCNSTLVFFLKNIQPITEVLLGFRCSLFSWQVDEVFWVEAQNFLLGMICQSEYHWAFNTWCQEYVFYLVLIRHICRGFLSSFVLVCCYTCNAQNKEAKLCFGRSNRFSV